MRRVVITVAVLLLLLGARAMAQAPNRVSLPLVAEPVPTPTVTATTGPLPTPVPEAWRRPDTQWVQLEVVDVVHTDANGTSIFISVHNQTARAVVTVAVTRVNRGPNGEVRSEFSQRYIVRQVPGEIRTYYLAGGGMQNIEAWGFPAP